MQPDHEPRRSGRDAPVTVQPWWLSAGAAAGVIAVLLALGGAGAAWTLTGASASAAGATATAPPRLDRGTPARTTVTAARTTPANAASPTTTAGQPDAPTTRAAGSPEPFRSAAPVPSPTRSARLNPVPKRPRIMLLGDSITYGVGSTALTGYRTDLGRRLAAAGVVHDFVGSQHSGLGAGDLDHEGHPGWRIDQVVDEAPGWLAAARPDVVLLDIGTNDYVQDYRTARAPNRLARLIDVILQASPTVRVVVAQLLVCEGPSRAAGIAELNAAIPGIAAAAGPRVSVADMSDIAAEHTTDGVHPDDTGYRMMARRWSTALTPLLSIEQ